MAAHAVALELWYDAAWNDHSADVLVRDQIVITRGKADEAEQPPPATATFTFKTWDFNPSNPLSPLHGKIGRNTPIRITVDTDLRFRGEVATWTPRQSLGGNVNELNRWVLVQATGITRRLGQVADPLQAVPRRQLPVTSPFAYWPLDDRPNVRDGMTETPSTSSKLRKSISPGTTLTKPKYGGGTLAPWLLPCLRIGADPGLGSCILDASVDGGSSASWTMTWLYRMESGRASTHFDIFNDLDGSTVFRASIRLQPEPVVAGENVLVSWRNITTSTTVETVTEATLAPFDGLVHYFLFEVVDTGTGCDYALYLDGVAIIGDAVTSLNLIPRMVQLIGAIAVADAGASGYADIGHLAIWDRLLVPSLATINSIYTGHVGEPAGSRIERLCDEEDVPFVAIGDMVDTVSMGQQYPDGFLALLHGCADVDRGLLVDGDVTLADVPALSYRQHRDLYNQLSTMSLNYAGGEVAPPLEPVIDDQQTRNDVTAANRDGDDTRKTLQFGPLSTLAPPNGVGRYQTSVTVNVGHHQLLGSQAGWRLHLGTIGEVRYPQVTVDLDAAPSLAAAVGDVVEGSRILLTGLPDELSPDTVSLLVLGWTETIESRRRLITFNCVPESAWHIAEVEHADYGIVGSFSSNIVLANLSQTTLNVNVGAGPDWVHEVDFDVLVGGERMTVTAAAAATGTYPNRSQVLTVVRSVNGVTKGHPSGTAIDVFHKSYIGL